MSETDWEKVKKAYDENAPIPYDGLEDGPYDPNDDAAVDRFFHYAISRGPRERAAGVASVRLDIADSVLEFFQDQDIEHWEEHINEVLKQYVDQQKLAKAS